MLIQCSYEVFSSSYHLEPSWDYLGPFWGHLGNWSRYRDIFSMLAILQICVQALRLTTFISISWYVHVFGQLGGMFSSFEARNLDFVIVVFS